MQKNQWFVMGLMLMIMSMVFFNLYGSGGVFSALLTPESSTESLIVSSAYVIKGGIYGAFGVVSFFLAWGFWICGFLEKERKKEP